MKKRFFLILSASGGAGHIRAAEALHQAAQSSGLPIESEHHDCLDFTSAVFKRIYSGSYLAMVNRAPELWGYLYGQAEKKPYSKKGLLKIFDHFNYGSYLSTLRSLQPDALICTHFLPFISISERIRRVASERRSSRSPLTSMPISSGSIRSSADTMFITTNRRGSCTRRECLARRSPFWASRFSANSRASFPKGQRRDFWRSARRGSLSSSSLVASASGE